MEPITTGAGAVIAFLKWTRTGKELDGGAAALLAKGRDALGEFFERRRSKREQNAMQVLQAAERKVAQGSGTPVEPDEGEVAQLLDAASRVDNRSVQELFANLLAAKFDAGKAELAHPAFSLILEQMSEPDARLLAFAYNSFKLVNGRQRKDGAIAFEQLEKTGLPRATARVCAENLVRLGVFDRGDALGNMNTARQVGFTPFGWHFAAVCLGEPTPEEFPYTPAVASNS